MKSTVRLAAQLHGRGAESTPSEGVVQRLILGAQGNLDTQNDHQNPQIVAELMSLDHDSLRYIRSMLDPHDEKDAGYVKLINYELGKADTLHAVSEASRAYGGIFTSAEVFLDGYSIGRTEPISHPDSSTLFYQYGLDPQTATGDELDEEHNSRNDSEVSSLEEAYNLLLPWQQTFTGDTQIRIVVAGTSGPCDGCKKRLEAFRNDVLELLPQGAVLSIDSSYLNSTSVRERNELPTRYGFQNQTQETSALGDRYFNYRYPLAQRMPMGSVPAQLRTPPPSADGMPANLQAGLEQLSGMDLSDVRVRYNSPKPAQLAAHAYTQGSEIHVAPGQEQHLPHEGWHVVQQKQGRVRPTMELSGTAINDDPGLEREADVMGARAGAYLGASSAQIKATAQGSAGAAVQRKIVVEADPGNVEIAETLKQKFPDTLAEVKAEKIQEALVSLRASAVDFGAVDLTDEQQLDLLVYYVQQVLNNQLGGQEQQETTKQEAWEELKKTSPAPEKTYKLAFLGRGSGVAYYINSMGTSLPRKTVVIGKPDPWVASEEETSRGQGYIGHTKQEIEAHGKDVPEYDEELVNRRDFAPENRELVERVETRVDAGVTSVKKDPKTGLYAIEASNGTTYYARKVVASLGAGPHTVPPEVKTLRGQVEKQEVQDPGDVVGRRVLDMDAFMRQMKIWDHLDLLQQPGIGKTVIVVGPNAGIDVVEAAGRLGFDVEWFVSSRSDPALLPGASMKQSHARRAARESLVATDRTKTKVELTGGEPPLKVSFFGRKKYSSQEPRDRTVEGDYYVYAIGQDTNAPGAVGDVLKDVKDDLEPIYDKNQAFGEAFETVLGLQAPGTTRESGLEVIGASAFSLAPDVKHTYLDQTYDETLNALGDLQDPLAVLAKSSAWWKASKVLSDLAVEVFDQYRQVETGEEPKNLEDLSRNLKLLISQLPKTLQVKDLSTAVQGANEIDERLLTHLDEFFRAELTAVATRLQHMIRAIAYFAPEEQKTLAKAIQKDIVPIGTAGRGVVSEMMHQVRSQPTDILLPPQLGPMRSSIAALNAAMPGYITRESNFSSDDRNMLRVHMATKYPDLRERDAEHIMGLILGHRRTGYHPFGYRPENQEGWPDWYRTYTEILEWWQQYRSGG